MGNEPMKVTFSQGIHEQSATQKETLGALRVLQDGRKFRYCKNGAAALVAGTPIIGTDCVANHQQCAVAAGGAAGSMTVTVTLGATLATVNQYKDGYLQVCDGGAAYGEGTQYLIDGHPAAALSTACMIQLREPVCVALLVGTSIVSLVPNPFASVVVAAAGQDMPAGVPQIAVTAEYYFWSQTGGIATALCTNTLGEGIAITTGAALFATVSGSYEPVIGWSYGTDGAAGVTTPVFLTID